jgi:hypothetical protein
LINILYLDRSICAVQESAQKHFPNSADPLNEPLSDPIVKFKIFTELQSLTGRSFTHVELNNTQQCRDLLAIVDKPKLDVLAMRRQTIEEKLAQMELPPNMHWIPTRKRLVEALEAHQRTLMEPATRSSELVE